MERFVETLTWLAGCCLVGAYIAMRGWSVHAAEQEIVRMNQARAHYAAAAGTPQQLSASFDQRVLQSAAPDTSTWSPKRVAEYRESLRQAAPRAAVLRIPRLGLQVPVYEGTSDFVLNRGAGRIAATAAVDSRTGNIGIAAHRDGFFRPLKDITLGDEMYLDTIADTRLYRVSRIHIVDPSDVGVLDPTPTGTITLVTCYPFYFVGLAPQRFIVRAQLAEQKYAGDSE